MSLADVSSLDGDREIEMQTQPELPRRTQLGERARRRAREVRDAATGHERLHTSPDLLRRCDAGNEKSGRRRENRSSHGVRRCKAHATVAAGPASAYTPSYGVDAGVPA